MGTMVYQSPVTDDWHRASNASVGKSVDEVA
jgi:hypothetical protein